MGMIDTLKGIGIGAGLMYYLDPDMGNRRRALLRDSLVRSFHELSDSVDRLLRDSARRLQGVVAETRGKVFPGDASERQLVERIRARLGHCVSEPSAIDVHADGNRVVLSGRVAAGEVESLKNEVRAVPGVGEVEDHLVVHEGMGGTGSAAEGNGSRGRAPQLQWSPTTRVLAAAIGGKLMLRCLKQPSLFNAALGTLGFGLFTRSVSTTAMRSWLAVPKFTGSFELEKTININAPVEDVYRAWTEYENFPRFMRNVREVRDLGNGRSHWTVAGPLGAVVHWDAVVTLRDPNRAFGWQTEEGAPVAHAGVVRFESNDNGSTRVTVRLTYSPPAGLAGHIAASLFGADPKTEMDEDLMRMKSFLETGRQTSEASQPPVESEQF